MHHIAIQGIKPDLGFIAICLIGFKRGEMAGFVMGVLIGILMDLFSGSMVGTNIVTKPIVGWVSGMAGRTILDRSVVPLTGILTGLSLASGLLVYLFLQVFRGGMDFLAVFRWIILPQTIYDACVGTILLSLFHTGRKLSRGWWRS